MCGIFGVDGDVKAATLTHLGLHALQHRGHESGGIAAADGDKMRLERGRGFIDEAVPKEVLDQLSAVRAIGHVRYSTAGGSDFAQPLRIECRYGPIACAHNGNLVNATELRRGHVEEGYTYQTGVDTEVILHLIARSKKPTVEEAIAEALSQVHGAYSILFLTTKRLTAVRDPLGFRPLVMGRLDNATIFASETCALDLVEASYVRDVQPGEMLVVKEDGVSSRTLFPDKVAPLAECIFEHVYFARPDSYVFEEPAHEVRKQLGRLLAKEHSVEADVVVAVPDSGNSAALGFSEASGIPFDIGLIRNHYIGRTFIQPTQELRISKVRIKHNMVRSVLAGKRVVLVDDSIVRANTSRRIVRLIRRAGAREIHVRISSPPTIESCYYGIDTPQVTELIAAQLSVEQIQRYIEADSLAYLSVEGLMSVGASKHSKCNACFTRQHPEVNPMMWLTKQKES